MKRFGFILQVLWHLVCRKDSSIAEIASLNHWQEQLFLGGHTAFFEHMTITDARSLMHYVQTREDNVLENVIHSHAYDVFQAIHLLKPEILEEFWSQKSQNNETNCGLAPKN
jgi:hypothetical protein